MPTLLKEGFASGLMTETEDKFSTHAERLDSNSQWSGTHLF